MTSKRFVYGIVFFFILVGIGFGAYRFSSQDSSTPPIATPPTASPAPAPSEPSSPAATDDTGRAQQPSTTYPVSVFFSRHPESDDNPARTFAVSRTAPDLGVARFAITELLKGPTAQETNQGYFTTARLRPGTSSCAPQDFTISIKNGTATLQFCRQFDHLGVVADGQADSTLQATLRQFSTVSKVIILNPSGDCEFDLSGMNLCKQ